jgi:hypothetical protein
MRYKLVSAVTYRVRLSSSPQVRLCGASGSRRVPRCSPSGEVALVGAEPKTVGPLELLGHERNSAAVTNRLELRD